MIMKLETEVFGLFPLNLSEIIGVKTAIYYNCSSLMLLESNLATHQSVKSNIIGRLLNKYFLVLKSN